MKKEQQNIIITIGIVIISNVCKQFHIFLLLVTFCCFFSCSRNIHSQNKHICESILHYDSITNKNVYNNVDEMPMFSEDVDNNLMRYIMKRYADDPQKAGLQLDVRLRFVIDKEGRLIGARVFNKYVKDCTEEEKQILKIVQSSPKWEPGICSGQKVDVLVRMRLRFVINENGRLR
ncbi:MAG: energy transducer TonB [Prevotella sp.]|jgi:protein TonB|nr:energy transducer TonB [Prevotella sp.]